VYDYIMKCCSEASLDVCSMWLISYFIGQNWDPFSCYDTLWILWSGFVTVCTLYTVPWKLNQHYFDRNFYIVRCTDVIFKENCKCFNRINVHLAWWMLLCYHACWNARCIITVHCLQLSSKRKNNHLNFRLFLCKICSSLNQSYAVDDNQ